MINILDITPEPSEGIDADLERLGFKYENSYSYERIGCIIAGDTWTHTIFNNVSADVDVVKGIITIKCSDGKKHKRIELTPDELHAVNDIKFGNKTYMGSKDYKFESNWG